jgi:hypothetical protein
MRRHVGEGRGLTPQQLRAEADARDAAGRAALTAGDARAAAVAFHQAQVCRLAADEMERLAGGTSLRPPVNTSTVNTVTSEDYGVAVSRGKSPAGAPALKAAQDAGYSLRAIAKALKVSPALLSMAAAGTRSIPDELAARFEKLTGFPASKWPRRA